MLGNPLAVTKIPVLVYSKLTLYLNVEKSRPNKTSFIAVGSQDHPKMIF